MMIKTLKQSLTRPNKTHDPSDTTKIRTNSRTKKSKLKQTPILKLAGWLVDWMMPRYPILHNQVFAKVYEVDMSIQHRERFHGYRQRYRRQFPIGNDGPQWHTYRLAVTQHQKAVNIQSVSQSANSGIISSPSNRPTPFMDVSQYKYPFNPSPYDFRLTPFISSGFRVG